MSKNLNDLIKSENIAEELDHDQLGKIANRVLTGYEEDFNSSQEWLADVKKVNELATLAAKKKSYPLPNSSNIKFPIITKAVYEFSSRTYPEIVKDGQLVKAKTIGKDYTGEKELKARKVAEYMNWQLYWENDDFELELDRLLNKLALIGFVCTKTYFDPIRQIVKTEVCEPEDLIINCNAKSIEDATRISHVIHVKLNDLISGSRQGIYCEDVVDKLVNEYSKEEITKDIDIIEQHVTLDLDEDDYEEPYIVTVVKDRPEILRIVARYTEQDIKKKDKKIVRITPTQYFTDFHFLVSPKGKFQSVGFGILLLHLNEAINTVLNQLVDSGQLANLQGGYIDSRLKEIGSGNSNHTPGEFKKLKIMSGTSLQEGILPINYKEPSNVLYQLLGLLIEAARDLSASNDIMSGNASPENSKTGATQALINEGVKVHNSINKRIYRSLGNLFYKIFYFDGIYLDPEKASQVLDEDIKIQDFDQESVDVIPVADPNLASASKIAADIQVLQALMTLPGWDPVKISHRIGMKLSIDKMDELKVDPNKEQPPNPEVIKIQADIQNMAEVNKLKGHELELKQKELQAKIYETQCKCIELKAKAALEIAQAESLEKGQQLETYLAELDMLGQKMNFEQQQTQMMHDYTSQMSAQQHEKEMQQQEITQRQAETSPPTPEASSEEEI